MKFVPFALLFCCGFIYAPERPPLPLLVPPSPPPLSRADVGVLTRLSARKYHLPPAFVKSIMAAESAFHLNALSPKGAIGLMQVMPATALEMGLNASVPSENIEAGTKYLAVLTGRYKSRGGNWLPRVIAAYNAGPGNVDKYKGVPPFRETRAYVARVLAYFKLYRRTAQG